jgi:hypothetical protein
MRHVFSTLICVLNKKGIIEDNHYYELDDLSSSGQEILDSLLLPMIEVLSQHISPSEIRRIASTLRSQNDSSAFVLADALDIFADHISIFYG